MSQRRAIAGREVVALCAPELDPLAEDVLEMLARLAARAGPPPDGARMRWAWSVLTLVGQPDGSILLHEPDFGTDPMREIRPVLDTTLGVVRAQAAFCRALGVTAEDCWFDAVVMTGPGALGASSQRLIRAAPAGAGDSGWYLADAAEAAAPEDPGAIGTLRAWELAARLPASVAALALPEGWSLLLQDGRIAAVTDPAGRNRPVPR